MNKKIERQPAIEAQHCGCLNCGVPQNLFKPSDLIAVGFGYAALLKDDKEVYREPNEPLSDDEYMTGAKAEEIAAADPEHDWRILIHGPLSGRTYQRHGTGKWVLIEQNEGFA